MNAKLNKDVRDEELIPPKRTKDRNIEQKIFQIQYDSYISAFKRGR